VNDLNKRRLLLAAAGLGAAVLGAGYAWRRQQAASQPSSPSPAATAFWSASFERPEGGQLLASSLQGQPLLLNFWATWCAPCVKEMPEIDQFQREHAGWRVLGLAVDAPTPVREFLKKLPVGFAIGLAGLTGTDLARSLGNLQGGLPFTVAFGRDGEPFWRKLGPTSLAELRELARSQA
jgi:thiol-disulfide isomerase/thioredoxin